MFDVVSDYARGGIAVKGVPVAARFTCSGVTFTSELPDNAGEAASINRAVERLQARTWPP
jgi:hypothetical protein